MVELTQTFAAVSEIECAECGQELKRCTGCQEEFHAGDVIYCDDRIPTKHYCSHCHEEKK